MNNAQTFAEIILPVSLEGTFTYLIPKSESQGIVPGMRVMVQFGQKKLYSGIVKEVHNKTPKGFDPKEILSILDDKPLITSVQLQFWNWLANYYLCTPGEVMNAALPNGLKLASETVFHVNKDFNPSVILKEHEKLFVQYVEDGSIRTLDDIRKSHFGNSGLRILKKLIEKNIILNDQQVKKSYKPRKTVFIILNDEYKLENSIGELMDKLTKAPAQLKALEEYISLSGQFEQKPIREVERQELTKAGVATHAISGLIKKGIFRSYESVISRIHLPAPNDIQSEPFQLADFQKKALKQIHEAFDKFPAVLLHGITSSGKTELYIHLINEQINKGKQVLYLLPEIALTIQIINRLKRVFGNKIGIYHSRYSDNERVEVYRNLSGLSEAEPYSVILGVRSAVFLPFSDLGLVIVDEEHENTYKQYDPAPRYHARDAATILGLFTGAKIVMGSATPSFESLYNTQTGKYGLVELHKRYGDVELPEIIVADIAQARKRKQLKSHFTPELISSLEETLNKGKQAIFFQNRRGFSNYLQCSDCGYIMKCKHCDVSMTYHKFNHEMLCHYCGFKSVVPNTCPDCSEHSLTMKGFGTEKLEDELAVLFPAVNIARLDLDQSRSRKAFERIIGDFEKGRTQILVGTQMVTKGLDFDNVNLVGIVDADSMLNFPDFRAFERSFQLMVQVSGRAGRRERQGTVIIQTEDTNHPVIQQVLHNDFNKFFKEQMAERKMFNYPPYVRMIRLTLKHEIPPILDGGAVFLSGELKEIFGKRVLGPQQPLVSKTHGKYMKHILVKIEKEASVEKAKKLISELLSIFSKNPVYKQIRCNVDVDPL